MIMLSQSDLYLSIGKLPVHQPATSTVKNGLRLQTHPRHQMVERDSVIHATFVTMFLAISNYSADPLVTQIHKSLHRFEAQARRS